MRHDWKYFAVTSYTTEPTMLVFHGPTTTTRLVQLVAPPWTGPPRRGLPPVTESRHEVHMFCRRPFRWRNATVTHRDLSYFVGNHLPLPGDL